jgi:hypothetical protein
LIVVAIVTALFPGFGSVSAPLTAALVVTVARLTACTQIAICMEPPLAMVPALHVSDDVVAVQVPWVTVPDSRRVADGNAPVIVTLWAALGPALRVPMTSR